MQNLGVGLLSDTGEDQHYVADDYLEAHQTTAEVAPVRTLNCRSPEGDPP